MKDTAPPKRMIAISKGSFLMGSDTGSDAEKPIHLIHLDEFYLDECLVSNKDFSEFVDDTGYVTGAESSPKTGPTWRTYSTEDRKDHPVIMVSWHDANQYSRWCGKSLPTEAQWERAARAGRHADLFPWGDQAPQTELAHWIQTLRKDEMPPTAPVTRSKPNAYGLYDMAGNVWQWCGDWYGEDYYSTSDARNPLGPQTGQFRVRRGGAWNVREAFRLRCANRGAMPPDGRWPNLGFRCAWTSSSE